MPDPLEPDQPAPPSGRGHGGMWQPPSIEEAVGLFPQYELLGLLGRGGMGAVFQARQIALDRLVAIKLLPLEVSADRDFADRFVREARAMGKLTHPNIITVYDFGQTSQGHLYFAMEYVAGANLHAVIHKAGLTPAQALTICEQVCTALAYAHSKGVVHRDIKPANVMLDAEGNAKVADFGLARLVDPGAEQFGHTQTGTVMGTPDYMAPEQKRGMNVDHRADIYSVGVMLYEMLCKETPQGAFEPASARTGCDPRIDEIVLKAMQQAPERRYQSTLEMKAAVDTARTSARALPRAATASKKSNAMLYVGLAAAAAVAIGAFIFLGPSKPKRAISNAKPTVLSSAATPAVAPSTPKLAATTPAPAPATPMPSTPVATPAPKVVALAPGVATLADWTGENGAPAANTWRIENGQAFSSQRTTLWSPASHGDFELEVEWKVGPKGNGGIFYRVPGTNPLDGPEMQLCDKANSGGYWSGTLYGIQGSRHDPSKPVGEWNTAKLVVRGANGEHWINGEKIYEFDASTAEFADQVRKAKLKTKPDFTQRSGRIVFQANGGEVAYRNVRIRSVAAVVASTPASTAAPEVVKWLAEQDAAFTAQWKAEAMAPFESAVAKLREQYVAAIDKNITDTTKAARLDEAATWKSEQVRIVAQQPHEGEDAASEPAALKQLRAWWRPQFMKLDAERFARAKAVHQRFDALLTTGQNGYTQKQRLDDAALLKNKRDEIAKLWLAPPVELSTPAAPKPTMGQTLAPPKSINAGKGTLAGRDLVDWFVRMSGDVHFLDADGANKRITKNGKPEDVPKGKLELRSVTFGYKKRDGTHITDQDFLDVAPVRKLTRFELSSDYVTGAGLDFLAGSPDLAEVELHGKALQAEALEPLMSLRNLRILRIHPRAPTAFPRLGELANLGELEILSLSDAPAGLLKARKLKSFTLTHATLTERQAAMLAMLPKLETLIFLENSVDERAIGELAKSKSIKAIELRREKSTKLPPFSPVVVEKLKSLSAVRMLTVQNCGLTPADYAALHQALPKCRISGD